MRSLLLIFTLGALLGCDDAPRHSSAFKPKAAGAAKDIQPGEDVPVIDQVAQPLVITTTEPAPEVRTTLRVPADELPRVEFRQPTEQEAAATALGRIGRAAVPSLIQALRHRDPEVRRKAALVLARIGPQAEEAVPELTASLDDQNEEVRTAATRALGQIGPAAAEAVPALMRRLVEPRPIAPQR